MRTGFGAQLAALAGILMLWEVGVRAFGLGSHVMPTASAVFRDLWANPELMARGIVRTMTETLLGFAIGAAIGFGFGSAFAVSRAFERLLFPLFVLSQAIPVIAFGALVVMWLGNGIWSKVAIATYLTAFPVTVNTCRGMQSVDPQRLALLRSFGAGGWTIFWRLRVPFALPSIAAALKLGISLGLIGAIVGEWFGDTVGLGILLLQAMYNENLPRLWALILVCGAIGIFIYALFEAIERRWIFWKQEI
ncbi:MAG: ABC transporter permease [Alphaproteobacteria bacterium]|nr:ABC transporter permease [Alphaproteobacteria bacterium]